MLCQLCKSENQISSKFCSSCGSQLVQAVDIKSPTEITLDWIIEAMKQMGYLVSNEDKNDNSFIAAHDAKPNLMVSLKPNLIVFISSWKIKNPGWLQKEKYLAAVNAANKKHWFCACQLNDEMNSLHIMGTLYLTEKISNRDIICFLDAFNEGVQSILGMPDILALA